mmetsp:Transcript_37361/g.59158  ORF Transcript_37361/g.59158 Transcript_37361/m.59158 type:complete len:97 (+) Transcript_37361:50-340(+)|eukprot:CAMPEP_0169097258 /NCGR_PEP_ID=MMETSP1015-20121227/19429_1 /TAXON_ID=342587 /ORGANISM="Karlodinium micrum, Strain CCMP2283" /LENGTH=96 /DNA_ID=CAMNT_0009158063 /DNA_START=50 /DNA_END=340 /DNA_ORIENTATION=+
MTFLKVLRDLAYGKSKAACSPVAKFPRSPLANFPKKTRKVRFATELETSRSDEDVDASADFVPNYSSDSTSRSPSYFSDNTLRKRQAPLPLSDSCI